MKIIIAKKNISKNYEENFKTIQNCYNEALKKDADLLVFGECFFTGYPLEEKYLDEIYINKVLESLEDIVDFTKMNKTSILLGCPYFIPSYIKDGIKKSKVMYDSMVLIKGGYIEDFVHRKDISRENSFNDLRYFDKGSVLNGFQLCDLNFFTIINDDIRENKNILLLQDKDCDFIMCFDSFLNGQSMENQIKKISQFVKKPIIYLNNLGVIDKDKIFDGKVFMTNSTSDFLINSSVFNEDFIEINIIRNNKELLIETPHNIINEDEKDNYNLNSKIFYIKEKLKEASLNSIVLNKDKEDFEEYYNAAKSFLSEKNIFIVSFENNNNAEMLNISDYFSKDFFNNAIENKIKDIIIDIFSLEKKSLRIN